MSRFEELTLKLMDPVHEIYMKGVESEEEEEDKPKNNPDEPVESESTQREASGEKC